MTAIAAAIVVGAVAGGAAYVSWKLISGSQSCSFA